MKKRLYAVIAAVVLLGVLAAAFFLGDARQPKGEEITLSVPTAQTPTSAQTERAASSEAKTPTAPSTTELPQTPTSSMSASAPEESQTSVQPTAEAPTATEAPSTAAPATERPSTEAATEPSSTAPLPTTEPPTTEPPTTEPPTTEPSAPQCTISVSCVTVLSHMDDLKAGKEAIIPANGWMLGAVNVELQEGDTVFDILQRVTREYGIALEFSISPLYNTAYIEGIGNLYERDCGTGSGWLYAVNGSIPSVGCSDYTVSDGDSIAWLYTCEMGADLS